MLEGGAGKEDNLLPPAVGRTTLGEEKLAKSAMSGSSGAVGDLNESIIRRAVEVTERHTRGGEEVLIICVEKQISQVPPRSRD